MSELLIGAAKADITPRRSCWMQGYANRLENGPQSQGVRDPLHVRALVASDGAASVALAICDLCNIDSATADSVRQLVCGAIGAAPEGVMIAATHTHAGPVSSHPERSGGGKTDAEWFEGLAYRIAFAILAAHAQRQPARLGIARGESHIGVNRQEDFGDGFVWLGHAPEKFVDRELIAVSVDSLDGRPIARLFNFGCHNTTLGSANAKISGDYAGIAMSALERELGAVCLCANGGAGNINPMHRTLADPDDPRVQEVGDRFAEDARKTLALPFAPIAPAGVAAMFKDVDLPRKQQGIEAGLGRRKRTRLQALRIGDLEILASPNEIVAEIVAEIKQRSPARNTLVSGYCYNATGEWHAKRDRLGGYLPTAQHWDQGGYEVERTPYAPEAGAIFVDAMVALAGEIKAK